MINQGAKGGTVTFVDFADSTEMAPNSAEFAVIEYAVILVDSVWAAVSGLRRMFVDLIL